ncbi:anaerobic ribonucleoside reductase large subunit [Aeromonas phage phiAS4]|uniref:Anaerobic ribonucleotide reductase subunit n=1 Tax=Aeromonas phage phiAS4 TaxID=879628 RepID=E1A1R4_9CAUD|nr:anaerobic ribonucleoside reductase large subunit [Aeromonas phage phiAS4]ADM79788.1 anaerobic ribonucleotide reductase subunit [Aeromonas phage phiAS4]
MPHLKERASISIGYIGLYEAALIMTGKSTANDLEARNFALSIATYLDFSCAKAKLNTGWNFSLYSTPSESLCDRFCQLDRKKYGVIEGITDKDWYTNSFHIPVDAELNPYDKIDAEKEFHWIASGGHISYVELPNMRNNLEALEQIWDYAMENLFLFLEQTHLLINATNAVLTVNSNAPRKDLVARAAVTTTRQRCQLSEEFVGILVLRWREDSIKANKPRFHHVSSM